MKNLVVKVKEHIIDGETFGWYIEIQDVKSPTLQTIYNTDKLMAYLFNMMLEDYRRFLINLGAVEQPANGVTYFETEQAATFAVPMVRTLIK